MILNIKLINNDPIQDSALVFFCCTGPNSHSPLHPPNQVNGVTYASILYLLSTWTL